MTCNDVHHLLETLQVQRSCYSIGTVVDDDTYCLNRDTEGNWSVGYWERGKVVRQSSFKDETTACEVFVALVLTSANATQRPFRQRLQDLLGPAKTAGPGLYP